jgi:hypothetical protein
VHGPDELKDQFPCDYASCQRTRPPFTRKDHYRDHLRDYHKEDLGCAKGERNTEKSKWLKNQKAWIEERKIMASWWRCHKCLTRIIISKSGWECQDCKATCDKERAGRIEVVRAREAPKISAASAPVDFDDSFLANCSACNDSAWIWNCNANNYEACTVCHPNLEQVYKTDEDWSLY